MNTPEKFFVFDVSALIYKAYFAMSNNPMKTSKGINVSTVHGVANQILAVITKENPDYVLIAYDSKGPTFRHERYPEYKANRSKMPEDLVEQIPLVKRMIDAMTLPSMEVSGWEADDIVGTISEKIKDKKSKRDELGQGSRIFGHCVQLIHRVGVKGFSFQYLSV